MNTNILIGETAEQVVFEILQSNNSQNDCWIEEFKTRKEALKWLNDEE